MELEGMVTRVDGQSCIVRGEEKDYRTFIPKRIQWAAGEELRAVAVGDEVVLEVRNSGEVWLQEVLPRRTWLARGSIGKVVKKQVVVANADQVAVVSSISIPPFRPGLIDRILIATHQGHLSPLIVVNKSDLWQQEKEWPKVCTVLKLYEGLGYPVIQTSTVSGDGIPELTERLRHKSTVVIGHSGVGKSSLLSAVDPSLSLKTQEVSRKTQWGQHTTTSVTRFPLSLGGFVIDTPGIREFSLWQVKQEELTQYFPEIARYASLCKYKRCTHLHEPDCAVQNALSCQEISEFRYQSYCRILESAEREEEEKDIE